MAEISRSIRVAYPQAEDLHLGIEVGTCRLQISPGADATWVSGRYHDPTGEQACRLTRRGGQLRVRQEQGLNLEELLTGMPTVSLRLGRMKPCAITIEEAASECMLDFGGLPIRELTIEGTAGAIDLTFSAPNPEPMRLLDLDAGAASVHAYGLANANFAELCLGGHGALYALDFSGKLRHPAQVNISLSSHSALELTVPSSTAAQVTIGAACAAIDAGDGWTRTPEGFRTLAGLAGSGPMLNVDTGLGLGNLRLRIAAA